MKRTNIWLKEDHLKKLKALSEDTGAPVSALIRKAIAKYLENQPTAGLPSRKKR
jgi:predicted DNA-binding protein